MVKSVTSVKLRLSPKIKGSIIEDLGIESTSFMHEGKEIFEMSRIIDIKTNLPHCEHSYKFDSMVERLKNKKIDEPMCPNCPHKNELIGPSVKRKSKEQKNVNGLDKLARKEMSNTWTVDSVKFTVMTFNIKDLVSNGDALQLVKLFSICENGKVASIEMIEKDKEDLLVLDLDFNQETNNKYTSVVHLEFDQKNSSNYTFSYIKDQKNDIIALFIYTVKDDLLRKQEFPDVSDLMDADDVDAAYPDDYIDEDYTDIVVLNKNHTYWIDAITSLLKDIALCNMGVVESKDIDLRHLNTFTNKLVNGLNGKIDVDTLKDLMDTRYAGNISIVQWCMMRANLFKGSDFYLQYDDLKYGDDGSVIDQPNPPRMIEARILFYCISQENIYKKTFMNGMLRSVLNRLNIYGRSVYNATKKFISFRDVRLENMLYLDTIGFLKDNRDSLHPHSYVTRNIKDDISFEDTLKLFAANIPVDRKKENPKRKKKEK